MSHTRKNAHEDSEILSRFDTLSPSEDDLDAMRDMREDFREFVADVILSNVPGSRERSLALTALEEALFWANKSIARHGVRD